MDNLAYLAAVVNEEPGPSGWINVYDPACKGQAKPVLYQTQILSSATKKNSLPWGRLVLLIYRIFPHDPGGGKTRGVREIS